VVGIKLGEILFIQAKYDQDDPLVLPLPAERTKLRLTAKHRGARPIVANKPPRGITYRELTGPGPKEHQPWTPDSYGDAA
jgi:hypothetical protein